MRLGERAHSGRAWATLVLLVTLGGAQGCVNPPAAEALVSSGYRTPRQTVESFQTFVRAELPAREYRCFSQGFRARNGLSAFGYGEVRDELFRSQPWLKRIAVAKFVAEGSSGEGQHWIDLEALGRTVRVKLVREDFFEIQGGEGLLLDGDGDFERLVQLGSDGRRLNARLALDPPLAGLSDVSEVLVARHWKIDELSDPDDDPPSPERAAP
ncbi:MAG TPA: hypothetical protein VMT18_03735 [Planctomycetota bacterium]|nr:hypothetical protein [Planctomycetota bacterium]